MVQDNKEILKKIGPVVAVVVAIILVFSVLHSISPLLSAAILIGALAWSLKTWISK